MSRRRRTERSKRGVNRPPQLDLFSDTPKFHSVIPIDREPILLEWRERCARVVEELARVVEDTRAFQEGALPAYRAWVAREFGAELSGLRDLSESLASAEAIHHATEAEASVRRRGIAAAYQAVMARKKAGEDLFPPDFGAVADDDWDEGWSEVDPFTDYHSEEKSSRKDEPSETPDVGDAEAGSPITSDDDRLKTLYRKLAFSLHPDANPELTSRERGLWAEVQTAYENRDLTHLEIIFAEVESGGRSDFSRVDQISMLQAVFRDRTHELRVTSAAFRRFKKDPAWRYWTASEVESELDRLRLEIERDLTSEYLRMRKRLTHHESLFRKWATGHSPR